MVKTIFLDRDGIITKLVQRNGYKSAPWKLSEFKFITGIEQVISDLKQAGYFLICITNQPDVYDGHLRIDILQYINDQVLKLGIDDIVVAYDRKSVDYKPDNGMIEKTLMKYNLNRDECILIGDTWKDIVAGFKSKLTTIYCNEEPYPVIVPEQYMNIVPNYYITSMSETMNILKDIK